MKIQLIRNATMRITYAGRTLLTDPLLAPEGAYKPFAGIARNPAVELPFQVEEIYARGKVWISDVVLGGNERVLRACITSFHSDESDIEYLKIIL